MTTKKEAKETNHKKCACNVWMYISIVLAVAFIVALVLAIVGATKTSSGIGLEEAKKLSLDVFEKMSGTTATITNAVELSDVYKITLSVQDQTGDIYISKDGKYLFPGGLEVATLDVPVVDTNTEKIYALPKSINQAPSKGEATDLIVLEASDFQCPYCGAVYGSPWAEAYKTNEQIGPMFGALKMIDENYIDTGKVKLIHYPVAFLGQESTYAANAALCADEQKKYFEMHDLIFDAQTMEENNGKYAKDKLKEIAKSIIGLDLDQFNTCVDSGKYDSRVVELTADMTDASKTNTGSFGTPLFYIVADATKYTSEEIANAIVGTNYKYSLTSDKTNYVIIANPSTAALNKVLGELTA